MSKDDVHPMECVFTSVTNQQIEMDIEDASVRGRLHVYDSPYDFMPNLQRSNSSSDTHHNGLPTHFSKNNKKNHLRDTIGSKSYTDSFAKPHVKTAPKPSVPSYKMAIKSRCKFSDFRPWFLILTAADMCKRRLPESCCC
jgi:hypothetical protein